MKLEKVLYLKKFRLKQFEYKKNETTLNRVIMPSKNTNLNFYLEQFIFTDFVLNHLTEKGFHIQKDISNSESKKSDLINYNILPLQNTYLLYTEVFDESNLRKKEALAPRALPVPNQSLLNTQPHPNTCKRLSGILCKPENKIEGTEQIKVIAPETNDDLHTYFLLRKEFPLWAVFIECENLKKFIEIAKPDKVLQFKNKKFGLIKQNDIGWDLLVHEGELDF